MKPSKDFFYFYEGRSRWDDDFVAYDGCLRHINIFMSLQMLLQRVGAAEAPQTDVAGVGSGVDAAVQMLFEMAVLTEAFTARWYRTLERL